MNFINHAVTINLSDFKANRTVLPILTMQEDSKHTITATFKDGTASYDITGVDTSVTFYAVTPDNQMVYLACTKVLNTAVVELTDNLLAVKGNIFYHFEISDTNSGTLHTMQFKIVNYEVPDGDGALPSFNETNILDTMLDRVEAAETGYADIDTRIANKLDKTGASTSNTVVFAENGADTDIISGETHGTLFGKILKSIKTLRTSLTAAIGNIGTIANLTTTAKGSLVLAVNEVDSNIDNKIKVATVSVVSTVTNIAHGMTYDSVHDDLLVFYNNVLLAPSTNYTIAVDGLSINLVGWSAVSGDVVYFKLYKNVK